MHPPWKGGRHECKIQFQYVNSSIAIPWRVTDSQPTSAHQLKGARDIWPSGLPVSRRFLCRPGFCIALSAASDSLSGHPLVECRLTRSHTAARRRSATRPSTGALGRDISCLAQCGTPGAYCARRTGGSGFLSPAAAKPTSILSGRHLQVSCYRIRPNTATPLVVPTNTLPFAIMGVMNLLPAPNWSRPPLAWLLLYSSFSVVAS